MWGSGPDWYFESTPDVLAMIEDSEPDHEYVEVPELDSLPDPSGQLVHGRALSWVVSSPYTVMVPVERVQFMEGNQWNPSHAAALVEVASQSDVAFGVPAARLYRIDEADVTRTEGYEEEDELSYQVGMERPWDADDAGTFHVQLVDGNHRAAAAMLLGEREIPVIVGENYREDVLDDEWVAL